MFGLPRSTDINRQLPKKSIYEKFGAKPAERKRFDSEVNRLSIVSEISPKTVSIVADEEIKAIYIILLVMKTEECDSRNIKLLSRLIDQKMLFALQYGDAVRFATYRAGRVLMSESKPTEDWELRLRGLDLKALWDSLVADIGGFEHKDGDDLDETIIRNETREKLEKQIANLERKAMSERQPRKKWDLDQKIRKLRQELEGV